MATAAAPKKKMKLYKTESEKVNISKVTTARWIIRDAKKKQVVCKLPQDVLYVEYVLLLLKTELTLLKWL